MYWTDKEFKSENVITLMSWQRFTEIERYMCLYNEDEARSTGESNPNSPNYDPNYKVTLVWKAFLLSAQQNKNPSQDMVIDEQIIGTKVGMQNNVLQTK